MEEVRRLFRSAARDCVIEDRNSFVAFQANTGVEVQHFRSFILVLFNQSDSAALNFYLVHRITCLDSYYKQHLV